MIDCSECQRDLGAVPSTCDRRVLEHVASCSSCANCLKALRALDAKLLIALEIPVPANLDRLLPDTNVAPVSSARTKTMACFGFAASVVLGLGTATYIGQWMSQRGLAKEAISHIDHAPNALRLTNVRVEEARLVSTLQGNGARLSGSVGVVSYVNTCPFRGRTVTHLVIQTERGPVTVLLLPGEKTEAPVPIDEDGYNGTIIPVDGGSIVVLGEHPGAVRSTQYRLVNSLDLTI